MNSISKNNSNDLHTAVTRRTWVGLSLLTTAALTTVIATGCDLREDRYQVDPDREDAACDHELPNQENPMGESCQELAFYPGHSEGTQQGLAGEYIHYERLGEHIWGKDGPLEYVIHYNESEGKYVAARVFGVQEGKSLEESDEYKIFAYHDGSGAWEGTRDALKSTTWQWQDSGFTGEPHVYCGKYDANSARNLKASLCGNGASDDYGEYHGVDLSEECDPGATLSSSCEDYEVPDVGYYDGGTLGCNDSCELDFSECRSCGNGAVDPGEVCDTGAEEAGNSENLDGMRCFDFGFVNDSGLGCKIGCMEFDVSECVGFEACDAPHDGPGCSDHACQTTVCDMLPPCCEMDPDDEYNVPEALWSPQCAELAQQHC